MRSKKNEAEAKRCPKCGARHTESTKHCLKCLELNKIRTKRHREKLRAEKAAARRDLAKMVKVSQPKEWRNREQRRRMGVEGVVREWNRRCPAGTRVAVLRNDGSRGKAVTCDAAEWIAGVPVVWVEGDVVGVFQLSRLEVE